MAFAGCIGYPLTPPRSSMYGIVICIHIRPTLGSDMGLLYVITPHVPGLGLEPVNRKRTLLQRSWSLSSRGASSQKGVRIIGCVTHSLLHSVISCFHVFSVCNTLRLLDSCLLSVLALCVRCFEHDTYDVSHASGCTFESF